MKFIGDVKATFPGEERQSPAIFGAGKYGTTARRRSRASTASCEGKRRLGVLNDQHLGHTNCLDGCRRIIKFGERARAPGRAKDFDRCCIGLNFRIGPASRCRVVVQACSVMSTGQSPRHRRLRKPRRLSGARRRLAHEPMPGVMVQAGLPSDRLKSGQSPRVRKSRLRFVAATYEKYESASQSSPRSMLTPACRRFGNDHATNKRGRRRNCAGPAIPGARCRSSRPRHVVSAAVLLLTVGVAYGRPPRRFSRHAGSRIGMKRVSGSRACRKSKRRLPPPGGQNARSEPPSPFSPGFGSAVSVRLSGLQRSPTNGSPSLGGMDEADDRTKLRLRRRRQRHRLETPRETDCFRPDAV